MADQQHFKILQKGTRFWNSWRKAQPHAFPDLKKANLQGMNLQNMNFRHVQLDGANLESAVLCSADLSYASLRQTNLHAANLCRANLGEALFQESNLHQANLSHVLLRSTVFANIDLRLTKGLNDAYHLGSSTIGLDTLERSKGTIPESFLRKAGVQESLFSYLKTLGTSPFDFPSCFISYSNRDISFVKCLYQDLQMQGVHCWFAPSDLQPGNQFQQEIDKAIHQHDKLLLVLSKHAIKSTWVDHEVNVALQKERQGKNTVLFPIRLDTAVMESSINWVAALQNKRHISSFENWKQPSVYQKALKKLLTDLRQ